MPYAIVLPGVWPAPHDAPGRGLSDSRAPQPVGVRRRPRAAERGAGFAGFLRGPRSPAAAEVLTRQLRYELPLAGHARSSACRSVSCTDHRPAFRRRRSNSTEDRARTGRHRSRGCCRRRSCSRIRDQPATVSSMPRITWAGAEHEVGSAGHHPVGERAHCCGPRRGRSRCRAAVWSEPRRRDDRDDEVGDAPRA
jgi:hypothetical protein